MGSNHGYNTIKSLENPKDRKVWNTKAYCNNDLRIKLPRGFSGYSIERENIFCSLFTCEFRKELNKKKTQMRLFFYILISP